MTKFRQHRGSLWDSMQTVEPCYSLEELEKIVYRELHPYGFEIRDIFNKLEVTYYGYDSRIDWNTYIISLPEYGVIGFTDGGTA